jgi:phenol 2-monooxygenase
MVPLLLNWTRSDQMELDSFHATWYPHDERDGYDYSRIYADPPASKKTPGRTESAHVAFDVSVGKGCMILVRPDQCISWIGEIDEVEKLEEHLGKIFLAQ